MTQNFIHTDFSLQSGFTYTVQAADPNYWDEWWKSITYTCYRRLQATALYSLITALDDLVAQGAVPAAAFLFTMDDWDREQWLIRAHRQCHEFWQKNPEGFPACGIQESFTNLKALRKARAAEKKAAKAAKGGTA